MEKNRAAIVADRVRIEYPILQSTNRSLKRRFVSAATGGRVARDASDHIVVTALNDVSITIGTGERVALVGHNGSGKTTFLRSIAGVYRPVAGEIRVTGTVSTLFDIWIGFDPEATGRENVILRGLVMVVMVLDHPRGFIHSEVLRFDPAECHGSRLTCS